MQLGPARPPTSGLFTLGNRRSIYMIVWNCDCYAAGAYYVKRYHQQTGHRPRGPGEAMHHTFDSVEQTHRLHYATELGWWLCACTKLKHRGVDSGTLLMACERVSHIQKCTNWGCHKKASKPCSQYPKVQPPVVPTPVPNQQQDLPSYYTTCVDLLFGTRSHSGRGD